MLRSFEPVMHLAAGVLVPLPGILDGLLSVPHDAIACAVVVIVPYDSHLRLAYAWPRLPRSVGLGADGGRVRLRLP